MYFDFLLSKFINYSLPYLVRVQYPHIKGQVSLRFNFDALGLMVHEQLVWSVPTISQIWMEFILSGFLCLQAPLRSFFGEVVYHLGRSASLLSEVPFLVPLLLSISMFWFCTSSYFSKQYILNSINKGLYEKFLSWFFLPTSHVMK